MEPGEESLDLPTSPVTPQLATVLSDVAASTPVGRDELHASLLPESFVELVAVVGFVADEAVGELVDETLVERFFEELDLVGRSACDADGERKTSAVCSCHDLGPLPALRFPDAGPPFFAPLKEASTKPSFKSNPPRSLRSVASARSTVWKVPFSLQRWNQRWQVW